MNKILPSLIEINQEYDIITKTSETMCCWHSDDKREEIIDECIECLEEGCFCRSKEIAQ